MIWDMMPMLYPNEMYAMWHWLMFPLIDIAGPELVWAVGIEALEYPPTWVTSVAERDIVEAALQRHFLENP